MKKLLSIITIMAMLFVMLTGCATNAETKKPVTNQSDQVETNGNVKIKIGIIQPVEHPSLNQIREYIAGNVVEKRLSLKLRKRHLILLNGMLMKLNLNLGDDQ